MPPQISLVICTRNRARRLPELFRALAALQGCNDWELVLVDNGSTDDTPDVLKTLAPSVPSVVRIISEPLPGLGRARNAGVNACTAPIIAFTDDDCYPSPDFLSHVLSCFTEDEDLGALAGRILLFDQSDYPITIQTRTERLLLPPATPIPAGTIQGANMSFRRVALDHVGGFDDSMGAGTPFACEDIEVAARVSFHGWRVAYDPRPLVYHNHGRKATDAVEALKASYDIGRGAYYAKMLLHSRTRRPYLAFWLRRSRYEAMRTTLRELNGAVRFMMYRWRSHRESIGSIPTRSSR